MALKIHSDASYLSASKSCSRVGGHFYLGNDPTSPHPNMHNGAVLTVANILKHIISSAAEAELAGLFVNCKEAEVIHTTLTEMGLAPLTPTPVSTHNTTAVGNANDTIQQRRSNAMDMRFYWVRDRVAQKHFIIQWAPGNTNLGDYHTKHFADKHHQTVRRLCLHEPTSRRNIPQSAIVGLRGCVDSPIR
jgi:predicted DNA-binding WGR domain protein